MLLLLLVVQGSHLEIHPPLQWGENTRTIDSNVWSTDFIILTFITQKIFISFCSPLKFFWAYCYVYSQQENAILNYVFLIEFEFDEDRNLIGLTHFYFPSA